MTDVLKEAVDKLKILQVQREALEIEADAIVSELESTGPNGEKPIGVRCPLIDKEGFPRGDIDVVHARNRRHRLAVINTDHKIVMKEIERQLPVVHSFYGDTYGEAESKGNHCRDNCKVSSNDEMTGDSLDNYEKLKPIAIIDEVFVGSPAESSGVSLGDHLLCFGDINADNSLNPLSLVPNIVKTAFEEKLCVPIVIRRKGDIMRLRLQPAVWSGRGLLGCHLSPYY